MRVRAPGSSPRGRHAPGRHSAAPAIAARTRPEPTPAGRRRAVFRWARRARTPASAARWLAPRVGPTRDRRGAQRLHPAAGMEPRAPRIPIAAVTNASREPAPHPRPPCHPVHRGPRDHFLRHVDPRAIRAPVVPTAAAGRAWPCDASCSRPVASRARCAGWTPTAAPLSVSSMPTRSDTARRSRCARPTTGCRAHGRSARCAPAMRIAARDCAARRATASPAAPPKAVARPPASCAPRMASAARVCVLRGPTGLRVARPSGRAARTESFAGRMPTAAPEPIAWASPLLASVVGWRSRVPRATPRGQPAGSRASVATGRACPWRAPSSARRPASTTALSAPRHPTVATPRPNVCDSHRIWCAHSPFGDLPIARNS